MHIVIFVLLAFAAGMLLHRHLVRTREAKGPGMPPPLRRIRGKRDDRNVQYDGFGGFD